MDEQTRSNPDSKTERDMIRRGLTPDPAKVVNKPVEDESGMVNGPADPNAAIVTPRPAATQATTDANAGKVGQAGPVPPKA